MQYITYLILFSLLLQGCTSSNNDSDFPNAGVITYNIDYPKEITDSPTANLMPDELKLFFKNDKRRFQFKGSFNIFSLDFYSLSSTDSSVTNFRFMDNNLLHVGSAESIFFFFDKKSEPTIELIDGQTKEIAGIECYKAIVSFPGSDSFSAYYSKKVNLQMPNRNTPFTKIPGVLMEFDVDYNNVRFHFTARNIDYSIPEDSTFEAPYSAKSTPEKEIRNLVLTLIKTLR